MICHADVYIMCVHVHVCVVMMYVHGVEKQQQQKAAMVQLSLKLCGQTTSQSVKINIMSYLFSATKNMDVFKTPMLKWDGH